MVRVCTTFSLFLIVLPPFASASEPASNSSKMPVKEITVFKDGHALVLHEGKMNTDGDGQVVLDQLPTPVIGTFWPYAADARVKLSSVTAGRKRLASERTAVTLREVVQANIGNEAIITENNVAPYPATIVGFLNRDQNDEEATEPSALPASPPQVTDLVLLKTAEATARCAVLPNSRRAVSGKVPNQTHVERLSQCAYHEIRLEWMPAAKDVHVGMAYLQKGIGGFPTIASRSTVTVKP